MDGVDAFCVDGVDAFCADGAGALCVDAGGAVLVGWGGAALAGGGTGTGGRVTLLAILDSVWWASVITCTMRSASRTASGPFWAARSGCQSSIRRK
jgi:hypothetical protein